VEFLADMKTYVPDGTPAEEVDATKAREATRARQLAAQGHLLRLWKPSVKPGEWRTIGLWRADSENELRTLLATLPLHAWMKVDVTPLAPHANDPGRLQPERSTSS
jgi:muconolactone D-isomerase